jgi:phage shock protein C
MNSDVEYGQKGLYRSSGIIFGVCGGIAKRFDLNLFWLRIATVIGFIVSGFFPIGVAYIVMALLMKPEPRW